MATNTMPLPTAGTANTTNAQDNFPEAVLIAEATGANAPAQPAPIPAAPGGEVHVAMPADQTVVRVQVAPGETIDLPFDGAMAAKFGDQGNLAIKVGDQTIILLGYGEANQQQGVTLHDSHGHAIDVAAVVAQTDPNLDIQTAAGPAAGPAGGPGGHLFLDFNPGAGLDGLGELGVINPTELQYRLIQPDEQILLVPLQTGDHALTITSTDGGASSLTEHLTFGNKQDGDATIADYLLKTSIEGKAITSSWVNGVNQANLTTVVGTDVTVTFKREGAANHNMVGIYALDSQGNIIPDSVKFIWLDASQQVQNVLGNALVTDGLGNAQPLTVDLGNYPAGSQIGFFLVQNGANNAADIALIKAATGNGGHGYDTDMATLNSQVTIDPVTHQVLVNGTPLSSNIIYTGNSAWNSDGGQHAISGVSNNPSDGLLYVGFEDKNLDKADKDYNDVVFGVDLGGENTSKFTQQVYSPQIKLGDSVNDVTQMAIHTSGFQANGLQKDQLVYAGFDLTDPQVAVLAAALGFDVSVSKNGANYDVTITETTAHTTAQWQDFVNHIGFASTSQAEGQRDLTYTVSDASSHTASSTAHVNVVTTHHESLMATDLTSHNGNSPHDITWGSGDDILYLDRKSGFNNADKHLDMGDGFNTLHVGITGVGITSKDVSHLSNVDHVDMTGYGTNQTTLKYSDVISMTDSSHTLRIDGDAGDKVTLNGNGAALGNWHQEADVIIGAHTYNQFQWHSAGGVSQADVLTTVLIDHNLSQTINDKA